MIIALTGGTGFVGRAFVDLALAAGHQLVALARAKQVPREGVEWIIGDLENRAALAELVRDVDAVVHVAGVVNAPDPQGFETGNVLGTLNLVDAALKEGVGRFVHVSSLSAREPGLSAYGASKAKGEKIVKASLLDWTVVRPPAIYGPHDKDMFELFRAARWGVVPVPGEGKASLIHVEDLGRLLLALLPGGEGVSQAVFEPDDGRPGGWEHRELALAIGWAVGRRPRVLGLSAKSLRRAAGIDGFLRGKGAKMTADRAAYLAHPDWTGNPAAGVPPAIWEPQVETRSGLKATADWYHEQGWM
ncbi:NAD(P)-dependent oxidoreductase [Novosphingobium sp. 9U]|uniref:NAD-dependent epimerase/dehydratase family protein n=1 Tax=Novosphingobium sp. 9U TaxID=2653158 RepID=UPI0012F211BF|nr:NAD(P)-dependent oxidoreductase [Novosphingobium sp. 9U]VWX46534.1 Epimerase [Novosphingobium sp. 9U]